MTNERRRFPRYSVHLEATVKLPGNENLALIVEDLCVLGCLLEYGPTLQVRQECEISMSWRGRKFQTPAVVAWKGEQGQVGLEFKDTGPEDHRVLREICAELLKEPMVRLPGSGAA